MQKRTDMNHDARVLKMSLLQITRLLNDQPHLQAGYERARETMGFFSRSSYYHVTSRCNLHCEGCYFFEGGFNPQKDGSTSIESWDEFFAAEARRGVTMGYYFGGEPALAQDVLRTAGRHITYGNLSTNGSIRIDPEIQARIHISVWGDPKTDEYLRGKPIFMKSIKNYAGDPRAIVAYTLNGMNLSGLREVAEICREHELSMTFNMFSPTYTYQRHARSNDRGCFPPDQAQKNPAFSVESLMATRKAVTELMDDFPETILYSREYNDWVTTPGPLFAIDPATGWATDCGARIRGNYRVFFPDLSKSEEKCCHHDIICAECRVYGAGFSTRLAPSARDLVTVENFEKWLDFVDMFRKIFLYQPPERPSGLISGGEKTT